MLQRCEAPEILCGLQTVNRLFHQHEGDKITAEFKIQGEPIYKHEDKFNFFVNCTRNLEIVC